MLIDEALEKKNMWFSRRKENQNVIFRMQFFFQNVTSRNFFNSKSNALYFFNSKSDALYFF